MCTQMDSSVLAAPLLSHTPSCTTDFVATHPLANKHASNQVYIHTYRQIHIHTIATALVVVPLKGCFCCCVFDCLRFALNLNISFFLFPLRSVILGSLCRRAHCPSASLCKCNGHKLELAATAELFELSISPSVWRCAVIARTRTHTQLYICRYVCVFVKITVLLTVQPPLVLIYLNGEISPVCLRLIMPCGI